MSKDLETVSYDEEQVEEQLAHMASEKASPSVQPAHVDSSEALTRQQAKVDLPAPDKRATAVDQEAVRSKVEAAIAEGTRPVKADELLDTILEDRFHIYARVGAGGMGVVYKAKQLGIDRDVAIKMLHPELVNDEFIVSRFKTEALAVSKLHHPNIIRIYDFGQLPDKSLYIVMEFLDGVSLENALRTAGVFPVNRALHILRQIAQSLTEAHEKEIVHRDLKPDNVFLTRVGSDSDYVKVLDFGIAKLREADKNQGTLTQAGMIFGTPRYMAPEQCRSMSVDRRADIYAIGVMAYEMLTGEPPFHADNPLSILIKHVQEAPKPMAEIRPDVEVDSEVEALVMKCLAKAPEERFQSAAELAASIVKIEERLAGRLQHVVFVNGERGTTAVQPQRSDTIATTPKRSKKVFAWTFVISLLVAAGLFFGLGGYPLVAGIVEPLLAGSDVAVNTAPTPAEQPVAPQQQVAAQPVAEEPKPQEPAPKPEAPPVDMISINFETEPTEAEVFQDGESIGFTPLTKSFTAQEKSATFVIKKEGYLEREVATHLDRDASFSIVLSAAPKPSAGKRTGSGTSGTRQPRTSDTGTKPAAPPPTVEVGSKPAIQIDRPAVSGPIREPAPPPAPKKPKEGMGKVGDLKRMEF